MGQEGIGVMPHQLSGGSENSPEKYYGRTITAAAMKDNTLSMTFEDGVTIDIFDNGQSCCETRYMRTDDDVFDIVGHKLVGLLSKDVDVKPAPEVEYADANEVIFFEVKTDKNSIVFSNHNEHNGYYGGFDMTIREAK